MGWAIPIGQWAIEPLHDGNPENKAPAAYGIFRRNAHGWYRVTQKHSEGMARLKMKELQEKATNVQASDTTRPEEA